MNSQTYNLNNVFTSTATDEIQYSREKGLKVLTAAIRSGDGSHGAFNKLHVPEGRVSRVRYKTENPGRDFPAYLDLTFEELKIDGFPLQFDRCIQNTVTEWLVPRQEP